MPLKLKVTLTLIGLSAVVLPIFLIAADFNLLGYFYQSHTTSKTNQVTPTLSTETIPTTTPSLALLSKTEFEERENNNSYLVINIDVVGKNNSTNYLKMTAEELKTLVAEETDLAAIFKTTNLILITRDLVTGEEVGKKLVTKGLNVSLYFYHD